MSDVTGRGVSLAEAVRRLRQILGKYQQDIGIAAWGTTVRKAQDQYRVVLVDDDGRIHIAAIAAAVDVSDRWARQLGKVDLQRFLGTDVSLVNPILQSAVFGGAVVDPRNIRALLSSDIVTVYGSQTQALLQRAATFDLLVQSRHAGVEIDPRNIRALTSSDVVDVSDKWARELGKIDLQRFLGTDISLVNPILSSIVHGGAVVDPRDIRALTSSDVVNVSDRAARLLGVIYGSQGQQLLQRAATFDLIVQLRSAGVEIDPRNIRAITENLNRGWTLGVSDNPVPHGSQIQPLQQRATTYELVTDPAKTRTYIDFSLAVTGEIIAAPGASNKLRLFDIEWSSTTDIVTSLRFAPAGSDMWPLQATGVMSKNLVNRERDGGANENLTGFLGAAGSMKGTVGYEVVAV